MSDESVTPRTFGAATLLSEEGEVLYTLIKGSEHLGRITDLVYGRVCSVSPDEFRFRHVLLRLFFNRFTQQKRDQSIPIQVEIGFDSIQVVLSITAVFEEESFEFQDLEIQELLQSADRVIYKTHAKSKKSEVSLVLTTQPEKLDANTRYEKWVIESGEVARPKRYTELGDVDLMELLKNLDRTVDSEDEHESVKRVKEDPTQRDTFSRSFKVDEVEKQKSTRIEGVTQKIEHEKIVIKADPRPEEKKGFFSKFFGKKKETESRATTTGDELLPTAGPASDEPVTTQAHTLVQQPGEAVFTGDTVESLDLEKSAQKIDRVRTEIILMARESKNDRIQRSMEGLMDEMTAEREQMKKTMSHLKAQLRKRELDFQIKEQALNDELQKKEESIRQKNNMIGRLKEQASQIQLKSARGAVAGGSEDALFKQKYHHAQKAVNELREENVRVMKQSEQLREKLKRAEEEVQERSAGISPKDHQALQNKYEALAQEMETLKAQAAVPSVATPAAAPGPAPEVNPDEFKKKLQAAVKVAAQYRKEAESLRAEVENLKQQLGQGNDSTSGKKSA